MSYLLSTSLWLPRSRPETFAFFADAANLQRITPPTLRFDIRTPMPVQMGTGAVIDYRIGLRGIPLTWRSEITTWNPPYEFVDTQLRGPYRAWVHTHTFDEIDDGTLVTDQVRYTLHGPAIVGRLAHALLVARDLTAIFEYRHHALIDALGCTGRARPSPVVISRNDTDS